jgi:hypothetical protein
MHHLPESCDFDDVMKTIRAFAEQLSFDDIVENLRSLKIPYYPAELFTLQAFADNLSYGMAWSFLPDVIDIVNRGNLYYTSLALTTLQAFNLGKLFDAQFIGVIKLRLNDFFSSSSLVGFEVLVTLFSHLDAETKEIFVKKLIKIADDFSYDYIYEDNYVRIRKAFAILATPSIIQYEMPILLKNLSVDQFWGYHKRLVLIHELYAFLVKLPAETIADYLPKIISALKNSYARNKTILPSHIGQNLLSYLIVSGKCTLQQLIDAGMKDENGLSIVPPLITVTAKWMEQIRATGKITIREHGFFSNSAKVKSDDTPTPTHSKPCY